MTKEEFDGSKNIDGFIPKLKARFPFYKNSLTEEVEQTLWHCFGQFAHQIAMDAIHAYALSDPDLNYRTFKIKALLAICFEESDREQATFKWFPCDESAFYVESHYRELCGLPELTVAEFAVNVLKKPRSPEEYERRDAAKVLQSLNAKSCGEIERIRAENEQNYTRYIEIKRQSELERKRGDKKKPDAPTISYADRARQIAEVRANEP